MLVDRFLPVSKKDMEELEWDRLDYVIVSGDAYVDHPTFGHSVISRVLIDAGFKVGIIAQPDWRDVENFKVLGRPRLGFIISPGNIDPMVNHYSVGKKRRKTDSYSPGGKMDLRPDRATIVYSNMVKRAYKKMPIIIGGIENSLRRFAHYDYWSDKVRRSILVDSEADILIFGMGEKQIVEIAQLMNDGMDIKYIRHIAGTCYMIENKEEVYDYIEIESFEDVSTDKVKYAKAFKVQYEEQDPIRGNVIIQKHKDQYLVQNPPVMPLTREELDWVYSLPYQRDYHPMYEKAGGIPAIREVKMSIISERGCYGSCSFCALTFHQGRIIQSRSHESIIEEANKIISDSDFKGYINDVGGPTANFREIACDKQKKHGTCKDKQCLFPEPCENLKVTHEDYLELLTKLRKLDNVKKVFVRSGIRYDFVMADKDDQFFNQLCEHHVSGQLKVAPEHIDKTVLAAMGKPGGKIYKDFVSKFYKINKRLGKEQYIVPYLMSSHPGSTLESAIELAEYLRDSGYQPEQVQDFYPTPGTLATTMYYTGLDPRNMKAIFVPRTYEEKSMQRALLQYKRPRNYDLVYKALKLANREDLIGSGPKCLIKDRRDRHDSSRGHYNSRAGSKTRTSGGNKGSNTRKPQGKSKSFGKTSKPKGRKS